MQPICAGRRIHSKCNRSRYV